MNVLEKINEVFELQKNLTLASSDKEMNEHIHGVTILVAQALTRLELAKGITNSYNLPVNINKIFWSVIAKSSKQSEAEVEITWSALDGKNGKFNFPFELLLNQGKLIGYLQEFEKMILVETSKKELREYSEMIGWYSDTTKELQVKLNEMGFGNSQVSNNVNSPTVGKKGTNKASNGDTGNVQSVAKKKALNSPSVAPIATTALKDKKPKKTTAVKDVEAA